MRISENKCSCSFEIMPITDYPKSSILYYPTWEDSGVLTLIYKINTKNYATLVDINLQLHMVDNKPQREVYQLSNLRDGWYKVRSYIFPRKDFLESLGMIDGYNDIQYQEYWKEHNKDNTFRKNHAITIAIAEDGIWFQGRKKNGITSSGASYYWIKADIVDVIDEFQTRGIQDNFVYDTNIRVIEEDFFNTCNLYRCFIDKASSLLDQYNGCSNSFGLCNSTSSIKCKSDIDKFAIQIRDYLWMTLNAIKYAVECQDYQTANQLLDCISACSGICADVVSEDCGCGEYHPITKKNVAVVPMEAYEKAVEFTFNEYYNKAQVLQLLNTKQDKLTAGIDINITRDNVINNEHQYLSNDDIVNMWGNE